MYTQENAILHMYKINVFKFHVFRIYNDAECKENLVTISLYKIQMI
jgi:hypothetical protein